MQAGRDAGDLRVRRVTTQRAEEVAFCLASGSEPPPAPGAAASWSLTLLGTVAVTVTAASIRDAVRQAA
jgi:hypothetical protein